MRDNVEWIKYSNKVKKIEETIQMIKLKQKVLETRINENKEFLNQYFDRRVR